MSAESTFTEIGGYKIHPAANLFPMVGEEEHVALKADINEHGQLEDIVLFEGQILDGRNRYRACLELGIDPIWSELSEEVDPVAYVLSKNLHRRHLTEGQRASIGAKIATLKRGKPSKDKSANLQNIPTVEQTAKMLGVSARSIAHAKTVRERGSPELIQAVERGEVSVSKAAKVAKVSPPEIHLEEATHEAPRQPTVDRGPAGCRARAIEMIGIAINEIEKTNVELLRGDECKSVFDDLVLLKGRINKLTKSLAQAMLDEAGEAEGC